MTTKKFCIQKKNSDINIFEVYKFVNLLLRNFMSYLRWKELFKYTDPVIKSLNWHEGHERISYFLPFNRIHKVNTLRFVLLSFFKLMHFTLGSFRKAILWWY